MLIHFLNNMQHSIFFPTLRKSGKKGEKYQKLLEILRQ